jgi:hypothetical protein
MERIFPTPSAIFFEFLDAAMFKVPQPKYLWSRFSFAIIAAWNEDVQAISLNHPLRWTKLFA